MARHELREGRVLPCARPAALPACPPLPVVCFFLCATLLVRDLPRLRLSQLPPVLPNPSVCPLQSPALPFSKALPTSSLGSATCFSAIAGCGGPHSVTHFNCQSYLLHLHLRPSGSLRAAPPLRIRLPSPVFLSIPFRRVRRPPSCAYSSLQEHRMPSFASAAPLSILVPRPTLLQPPSCPLRSLPSLIFPPPPCPPLIAARASIAPPAVLPARSLARTPFSAPRELFPHAPMPSSFSSLAHLPLRLPTPPLCHLPRRYRNHRESHHVPRAAAALVPRGRVPPSSNPTRSPLRAPSQTARHPPSPLELRSFPTVYRLLLLSP